MVWTRFFDMHSGGGSREPFDQIFIELPKGKAIDYFEERFGHHPDHITCDCCGKDYSVSEYETLEEATAFKPLSISALIGPVLSLEQYVAGADVNTEKLLIVTVQEIEHARP